MRELKFRAWDKSDKQMISPDFITRDGRGCWKSDSIPTSSAEIMQFTGLKDKNGKEVFESDVLKNSTGRLAEVIWFSSKHYVGWDLKPLNSIGRVYGNMDMSHWGVIGNIYENQELLK